MIRILICGCSVSNLDGWAHDALKALGTDVKLLASPYDNTEENYSASCTATSPDMVYVPESVLGSILAAEEPFITRMLAEFPHYTHRQKPGGEVGWALLSHDPETGFSMDPCEDVPLALSA
jgi:hypothetical protein